MGIVGFERKLEKLETRKAAAEAAYDAAYELSQQPREAINSAFWRHRLDVLSRRIERAGNAIIDCWNEIASAGVLG